jgi:dTDP-3-amino-3,4,6-trideoxy-alpha-D-glucose transaminase
MDAWLDQGRDRWRALAYEERLEAAGDLRLPSVAEGSEPVWHVYAVSTADPAALAHFLAERRVRTARHYPEPHLSAA